jgi:hypothetical protein
MPESPTTYAGFFRVLKRKGYPALSAVSRIAEKSAVQIPCHVHLQISKIRGVCTNKMTRGALEPLRARRPIQRKDDRNKQASVRRFGGKYTPAVKLDHLPGVQHRQALWSLVTGF